MRSAALAGLAVVVVLALPAAASATFPGRNGPIAFVSQHDECFFPDYDECSSFAPNVLEVRPGQHGARQLAVGFEPRYSPDRTRLVVDRCYCEDFVEPADTIFVKPLGSDTPAQPLLAQGPRFRNIDPAWSPDGRHLAFARSRALFPRAPSARKELWSITATGSELRQLGLGGSPDWSSTGRIAFAVPAPGGGELIKTMKSDGSEIGH